MRSRSLLAFALTAGLLVAPTTAFAAPSSGKTAPSSNAKTVELVVPTQPGLATAFAKTGHPLEVPFSELSPGLQKAAAKNPGMPLVLIPQEPSAPAPVEPIAPAPEEPIAPAPEEPIAPAPEEPTAPDCADGGQPALVDGAWYCIVPPGDTPVEEPTAPAIVYPNRTSLPFADDFNSYGNESSIAGSNWFSPYAPLVGDNGVARGALQTYDWDEDGVSDYEVYSGTSFLHLGEDQTTYSITARIGQGTSEWVDQTIVAAGVTSTQIGDWDNYARQGVMLNFSGYASGYDPDRIASGYAPYQPIQVSVNWNHNDFYTPDGGGVVENVTFSVGDTVTVQRVGNDYSLFKNGVLIWAKTYDLGGPTDLIGLGAVHGGAWDDFRVTESVLPYTTPFTLPAAEPAPAPAPVEDDTWCTNWGGTVLPDGSCYLGVIESPVTVY